MRHTGGLVDSGEPYGKVWECGDGCPACAAEATPERLYAFVKVAAGDYLLPSNDGTTLWRFTRYTDGPSLGLTDWPADRDVWWIRRRPMPESGELGRWEVDLDPWEDVRNCVPTRRECVAYALESEA